MTHTAPRHAFCTIVAKNYVAYARTLCQSLAAQHPDVPRYVLIVDDYQGQIAPQGEPFEVIGIERLSIPELTDFTFKYSVTELCTAVKPYLLDVLLHQFGCDQAIYLDPDIFVYQPLDHLFDLLRDGPIILTPHTLSPLPDDGHTVDDSAVLKAGIYNLGFVGVARSPATTELLHWWQSRLYELCLIDTPRGLFVDQKWMDFVPGFSWGAHIVRDPGYNVAYWNLHERQVHRLGDQWQVNGAPLYFYHFSGIQLQDIEAISKHQDRYNLHNRPELRTLFEGYRATVLANGHETCRRWPYSYGLYADGKPVTDLQRHYYRTLGPRRITKFPRPFETTGTQGVRLRAGIRTAVRNARRIARNVIRSIINPATPLDYPHH